MNSGKALVVSVDKQSIEVTEHQVGEWTFDALHWDVVDGEDVKRLLAELEAYPERGRTVVKYSLAGTLGLEATRELEAGLAAQEHVFGALYPRDRIMDLHLEPDDDELEALPITGYARDAMSDLIDSASGAPAGDTAARDAVNLLFRLSKEAN